MWSSTIQSQKKLSRVSFCSQNLDQKVSLTSVKQFNQQSSDKNFKTKHLSFRIKKYESMQTDNSQQTSLQQQERRFIESYKNDIFFRKKIDFLIRDHEKRLKANKPIENLTKLPQQLKKFTWRAQKLSDLQQFISLCDRYKHWIAKTEQ